MIQSSVSYFIMVTVKIISHTHIHSHTICTQTLTNKEGKTFKVILVSKQCENKPHIH